MTVVQPQRAWLLTWAAQGLQHLQLTDSALANLHWLQGGPPSPPPADLIG